MAGTGGGKGFWCACRGFGVSSGGTGRGHSAVSRRRDRIQPYMQLFQIEDGVDLGC